MAQNIICGPWERTKGPWLCLMTHYHYLVSFDYFPLFSHVLTSPIKLILWLKFSRQKAGRGHGRTRTIVSFSVSIWDRADVIIIEIKCPINEMQLNYPETISPATARSVEKLSSTKLVPTAKNYGDCWFKSPLQCALPWGCFPISLLL